MNRRVPRVLAPLLVTALLAPSTRSSPELAAQVAVPDRQAAHTLVEAERAFARAAADEGVSPAFLDVLDEEGVVFQPGPVNGLEAHRESPAPPDVLLSWRPEVEAVSAAGDLGYTSGPYEARARADASETSWGHYVSIWRRDPDREDAPWKLLVDIGTPHPSTGAAVGPGPGDVRFAPARDPAPPDWSARTATEALSRASERLHGALDGRGGGEASAELDALVLPDVRVYTVGEAPTTGTDELARRGTSVTARRWDLETAGVARSRDLGYVVGTWTGGPPATPWGNVVEIWTSRDGGWRLGVIVLQARPPEGGGS